MRARELKRPDHEGECNQDDDIGGDVVEGVGEPEDGGVDAGWVNGGGGTTSAGCGGRWWGAVVPEIIDRRALEDGRNDGGNGVDADEGEAAPAGSNKPGSSEDAEVEG